MDVREDVKNIISVQHQRLGIGNGDDFEFRLSEDLANIFTAYLIILGFYNRI